MRPSNNDSVAEGNIKDNRDDSDADGDHIRKNSTWDYRIRRASCLAFATGCLWILLFPLVTITTGEAKPRGTFFDENAMLVHHTMVKLTPEDVAWAQPAELRQTYSKDYNRGSTWMCAVLRDMDFPCYTHTFYEGSPGQSSLHTSVYTVLEPVPGADGKECLILTTEQSLSATVEDMLGQPAVSGLSLSLAILKHLKDHVGWMSKRLIFLVADEDFQGVDRERVHLGVKRFVDDYHTDTLELLERHSRDPKMTRSLRHGGVIRAAISLDFAQPDQPDVVQVLTSGVNGELPNMDHLNAVVYHNERQGIAVMLDMCSALLNGSPFMCEDATGRGARILGGLLPPSFRGGVVQQYLDRLFGMLGFMSSVALGPSGAHAHFLRHSIDALTIRGLGAAGKGTMHADRRQTTGSMIPSTIAMLNMVRGISNLEEELHHSVFSYMMLSTKAFVSIGEYAYSLALLLLPLALQGRRLTTFSGNRLVRSLFVIGIFEAFGALLLCAASAWPEPSEEALSLYLKGVDLMGYLLVLGVRAYVLPLGGEKNRHALWEGPKALMACLLAYSCSVTGLLSWQIATLLAFTHVPLLMMALPFKATSVYSWFMAFAMVVSSPARWASWLGIVTSQSSGTSIILQWVRWFQLSGLLNVPFMCLVSVPVHLTVAFVLFSTDSVSKR